MPTSETITLDPSEAILGRQEFDITNWIDQDGIDWGEASIEPIMAEKDRGDTPVDFRLPNREITAGLSLVNRGTVTAIQARTKFQAKVSLFQKEGGVIRRVTNGGGTVYADVVDASIAVGSPTGYESKQDVEFEGASVSFVCLPDFYEAEVDLGDNTETTLPELIWEETSISGDYPARCRIVVDDDSGNNQRGLLWGFRSRHYSNASTSRLAYQAETLDALAGCGTFATTGASGGTAVGGTIWPVYTPVLHTTGTAAMTHTGSYRAWARVWMQGTVDASVRFKWDVGSGLVNPVTNDATTVPKGGPGSTAGSAFYMADLGEVRLDPSPVGSHYWEGQIEARTTAGTTLFRVDRFFLQPFDEGAGRLTAPIVSGAADMALVAFDNFDNHATGGTLSAGTALLGGAWDAAGDATPFIYVATGSGTISEYVRRTAAADADLNTGQYVVLAGDTYAGCEVQADISIQILTESSSEIRGGVLARYVDTNNWLMAVRRHVFYTGTNKYAYLSLLKRVSGVVSTLGEVELGRGVFPTGWYSLKLAVDAEGNAQVYTVGQGGDFGDAAISINADANLATGGALDDGKVGLYDATDVTGTFSRYYDNFQALEGATPDTAVIYGSATTQLTTDGHYRLDSGATAYGPVSKRIGDLPRLPVSGLEGRTTQVFLKASRGDFEDLPDAGIDDISARIYYSPSWLTVPDT